MLAVGCADGCFELIFGKTSLAGSELMPSATVIVGLEKIVR
jgi:hypothetical protein